MEPPPVDAWQEALNNQPSRYPQRHVEEEDPSSQWEQWNRTMQHSPPSDTLDMSMSFMQHGSSATAADSWDAAYGDAGDFPGEFTAPTYAQDDSGVTWKKMDVEDKPPEWNGDDPLNQAEAYINLIRMWKVTTSHDKGKQAKMVSDRMKLTSILL